MKNVFTFIAVLVASIAGLSSCDDDTVLRDVVKEVTILVSENTGVKYPLFEENNDTPIESYQWAQKKKKKSMALSSITQVRYKYLDEENNIVLPEGAGEANADDGGEMGE